MMRPLATLIGIVAAASMLAASAAQVDDASAMTQFQRAADTYAFQHRQVERRIGTAPDQSAMAKGMRAARTELAEGDLFSPLVAAAFRARINRAFKSGACARPDLVGQSGLVPRVNTAPLEATPIPDCLAAALPRLPDELHYRAAGVALILVDTHANLVVDVLHAAFPQSATP